MDDGYVSKVALTAIVLWLTVVLLFIAAWAVALASPGRWLVAIMLATSACAFATFTGTLHNRIYVERVTRLIRACSNLERGGGQALRPVRDDASHRG